MPSYEHRGKNSYRLTVETEPGAGKSRGRERKTVRLPEGLSPKKQKEWLDTEWYKFKAEVETGNYITPEKMTLSAFYLEWKEKYARGKYAPKTDALNDFLFTSLIEPYLGNIKLSDFTTLRLVNYFNNIADPEFRNSEKKTRLSASTMTGIHRLLKNIFDVAVTWKVIPLSPLEGLKYPKPKKTKAKCYNKQESQKLLELLEREPLVFRVIVTLAVTAGLRRGEIAGLEWRHLDLNKGIITIDQQMVYTKETGNIITPPKSEDGNRKVSIPKFVIGLLKQVRKQAAKMDIPLDGEWKDSNRQFVLRNSTGAPCTPSYITYCWIKFLKETDLPYVKFHELRHTSASLLINSGVHSKIVSDRLGHSDIKITINTYAHVFEEAEQQSAEVLDNLFNNNQVPVPKTSPN
ncbi:site-specific integrase [Paenibacillus massiliensis]|uniref:site-specific integrase n=1 Tax=Paenibacillus massiliensis TaxID=225917 RepID=UPI00046F6CD9|nr:site-specific integrase [Paenibacillus massiliensis]